MYPFRLVHKSSVGRKCHATWSGLPQILYRSACSPIHQQRMDKHAKAVQFVYDTLSTSFRCIRGIEGSSCSLAITSDNQLYLPIAVHSCAESVNSKQKHQYLFTIKYRNDCFEILVGIENNIDCDDLKTTF